MTTTNPSENGRPRRVMLANALGGPLLISAASTAPVALYTVAMVLLDRKLPFSDAIHVSAAWPLLTLFFLMSGLLAGCGAALYAGVQAKLRGAYSIPVAIATAASIAFVVAVLPFGKTTNASVIYSSVMFAALGAAMAGWLARRSGAKWR